MPSGGYLQYKHSEVSLLLFELWLTPAEEYLFFLFLKHIMCCVHVQYDEGVWSVFILNFGKPHREISFLLFSKHIMSCVQHR